MESVLDQLRRHSVAYFSLFIAISGLAYNTWRNEKTEEQRSVRHAAFVVLENLGDMQEIVDTRYYFLPFSEDMSSEPQLRLRGFGSALMSRDLMNLLPPPAPAAGQELHALWVKQFLKLDQLTDDGEHSQAARTAEEQLREAIGRARDAVLQVLENLD
ncbi:MAG TPA: hypothetical protein VKN35_08020 [Xanthomonadales bacterium]|nr:hypothetical protein [Xanthomonadales bacterium]